MSRPAKVKSAHLEDADDDLSLWQHLGDSYWRLANRKAYRRMMGRRDIEGSISLTREGMEECQLRE